MAKSQDPAYLQVLLDVSPCQQKGVTEEVVPVSVQSFQLRLTLCDPMDRVPPGSSSTGFSRQESMGPSGGSSQPRDQTHICLCFYPLSHLGSPWKN